jgi:hypothetical protein
MTVMALAVRANGDLTIASTMSGFAGSVDIWNGIAWSNLLTMNASTINTMRWLANGDLVIGGFVGSVSGVSVHGLARWDGSAWSDMQLGYFSAVYALEVLPNGDLLAGGSLTIGGASSRLARWNGVSWTPLDGGSLGYPDALALLPDGEIAVGGTFSTIGTVASPYFATLHSTCPATAVSFGAGCVGGGGLNQFAATALPWLGATWRARATGMPPLGVVAFVTGFTPVAVPLPLLFAEAGPNCLGYASPDWIDVALASGGSAATQLTIPNTPGLIGVAFHQYALTLEFDALGSLTAITSSNALTVTIGSL